MTKYIISILAVCLVSLMFYNLYLSNKNNSLDEENSDLNYQINQQNNIIDNLKKGIQYYEENAKIASEYQEKEKEIVIKIQKEIIEQEKIVEIAIKNNDLEMALENLDSVFGVENED